MKIKFNLTDEELLHIVMNSISEGFKEGQDLQFGGCMTIDHLEEMAKDLVKDYMSVGEKRFKKMKEISETNFDLWINEGKDISLYGKRKKNNN